MFTVLAIEAWRVLDKVSNALQYVALLLFVGGIVGVILSRSRRDTELVSEKRHTSTLMLFGAALAAIVSAIAYAAELTVTHGW